MFQINDTVMYGHSGVCRIVDIRRENFSGKDVLYYVLKPVGNEASTIYCPVDSDKIHIRRLLSIEEIHALVRALPESGIDWIDNDQQRREQYTQILRDGDCLQLMRLIRTLFLHRQQLLKAGRKFHQADEKLLKEAEKVLHGEFAHVLQIAPEEVAAFIMGELGAEERAAE